MRDTIGSNVVMITATIVALLLVVLVFTVLVRTALSWARRRRADHARTRLRR